jgi:hypothetical protein
VRRDRKRGRLVVSARCPSACRLDAYLMTRRPGKPRFRTQSVRHSGAFSTRTRHLHFRIPAHAARLRARAEVVVVAFDRSGASSRVTRNVLIR